jgi:hypothetical protein
MYTHVSKCKNDKIKGERKKKLLLKNLGYPYSGDFLNSRENF